MPCCRPGALTVVALEAGGDVLEFAGDALVVFFETPSYNKVANSGGSSDGEMSAEEEANLQGEKCALRYVEEVTFESCADYVIIGAAE